MSLKQIINAWQHLERRTKLMALGTFLLIGLSICLSFGNLLSFENANRGETSSAEEGVVIEKDAEPIPLASENTQLVASLIDLLANQECTWLNPEDPYCSIQFTERGFNEYYGDIQTSCTFEFYDIEVTQNGRSGIWRIVYPDGSTYDARFRFIHDADEGLYVIESSAFTNSTTYETAAFSSGNAL